jgi:hypothetical protein
VDQNQTYTSHPAHQVFLREFELNGAGDPVETGRLLGGEGGEGLAPWSAVKAQARDLLGIVLEDTDVLNVPLLAVDPYGNFIPGPNGFAQLVTATGLVEGTAGRQGHPGQRRPHRATRSSTTSRHHAVPVGDIDPSDGPSQIVPLSPDSDSRHDRRQRPGDVRRRDARRALHRW